MTRVDADLKWATGATSPPWLFVAPEHGEMAFAESYLLSFAYHTATD
jgi:hypothetical protein